MDNFFCSHRCTSDVRLWLGARSVLITPARPGYGLALIAEQDRTFSIGDVLFYVNIPGLDLGVVLIRK
jgi:hypothetical protein